MMVKYWLGYITDLYGIIMATLVTASFFVAFLFFFLYLVKLFFFLVLQLFSGVAWKDKEFMHKPAFYMDISTLLAAKVCHSSY